ncbi:MULTISPECIES: SDR family NAD(P)-dependent oxidoreductase [Aeromicrobium]|uniref:SDR family NAD(P)-dependent oxidoreductase n=1 Tax=Aeromicrobium TaxID=2040 RepID=UPI0025797336|nr:MULTISPECIES: SDR family oxidoreductase [Aeromicrobium]
MSQHTMDRPATGTATFDFTGSCAVVTGASGGIGSAIAEAFARAGADVVLHGRNVEALEEVAGRVTELGRRSVIVSGNMRDPQTARAIVDATVEEFGSFDILVNNAGGNFAARLEDLSVNAWNATIETNLSGPFHLASAAYEVFKDNGGGAIVNIGSISANYAHPLRGAYAAAKAGLASLTRTMAWEWSEANVRVNCIEPGAVQTQASRFVDPDLERRIASFSARPRVGRPEDIASMCLFLASDDADYITGETIKVAGGPPISSPAELALIRPEQGE